MWDVNRAARSTGAAAAVLAAVLALSHDARAVDASGSDARRPESVAAQPRELARVRYRQGVEAYKEGHFREGIDLFLDADQLAPSAALSFNIAAAYEKIDQPAAALRWYRDYVRRAPDAADRAQVEAMVRGFEQALEKSGVQQLTVSSTPLSATLIIDGQPVGVTPWTGEIPPGSHQLELGLDGRASASRTIEIPSGPSIDY